MWCWVCRVVLGFSQKLSIERPQTLSRKNPPKPSIGAKPNTAHRRMRANAMRGTVKTFRSLAHLCVWAVLWRWFSGAEGEESRLFSPCTYAPGNRTTDQNANRSHRPCPLAFPQEKNASSRRRSSCKSCYCNRKADKCFRVSVLCWFQFSRRRDSLHSREQRTLAGAQRRETRVQASYSVMLREERCCMWWTSLVASRLSVVAVAVLIFFGLRPCPKAEPPSCNLSAT